MLVYHPVETSLGSIGRVTVSNKGVVMKSLSQSGYPAEWQTMMQDLKTACILRRVRASSSHSYYKAPSVRWGWMRVDVNVDGMELVLSPAVMREKARLCGGDYLADDARKETSPNRHD
jgi:hypothetical protein